MPKRDTYARFCVPEYWLFDPRVPSLRVLRLREGVSYAGHAYVERDETYEDERHGVRLVPSVIVEAYASRVDGVGAQRGEIAEFGGGRVRRGEVHRRRDAGHVGLLPA